MRRFNVTYEIVTPESAEQGDAEERGFLLEDARLREAVDLCESCGTLVEADSSPLSREQPPRWLTFYGDLDYRDGSQESRSLHLPEGITPSSALRIARLVGCYGL
jgi:hypothetical protein